MPHELLEKKQFVLQAINRNIIQQEGQKLGRTKDSVFLYLSCSVTVHICDGCMMDVWLMSSASGILQIYQTPLSVLSLLPFPLFYA